MFLFDVVSATVDKTMIASFESGEEIKGTEFFKSKDDIMRCFPFFLFSLEGCPGAPFVSRQNRNFMSERGEILSRGKFSANSSRS